MSARETSITGVSSISGGDTVEGAGPRSEPVMVAAGRRLVATAAAAGIPVRLIGGVAIWVRASPAARAALGRDYPDVDLVAHKRQSRALRAVLEDGGYQPERVFNATHGARRLLYHSPDGRWQVDVFLDTFEMSHTLDLGARLEAEPETLPAAELLLTKLQIAEVNAKDISDTAMLLWDHEPVSSEPSPAAEPTAGGTGTGKPGTDGPRRLNLAQLARVCGADWGLYTTVTDNLAACSSQLGQLVADEPARGRIQARIETIRKGLAAAPKSMAWRMRAKVGRRVRWYELPEEVTR
jgi:hypothetical protein